MMATNFILLAVIITIFATSSNESFDILQNHFEQINNGILSSVQGIENEFMKSLDQEVHRIRINSNDYQGKALNSILETFPEKTIKICFFTMTNPIDSCLEEHDIFIFHRLSFGYMIQKVQKNNYEIKENIRGIFVINKRPFLYLFEKFISNMKNILRKMSIDSIRSIQSSIGFLMNNHSNMTNHFLTEIYQSHANDSLLDIILVTQINRNALFLLREITEEEFGKVINFYKIYRLDFKNVKDYFVEVNLKFKNFFLDKIYKTLLYEINYRENEEHGKIKAEETVVDLSTMKILLKHITDIRVITEIFELKNIQFCKLSMKKQNLPANLPETLFGHIKLFHLSAIIYVNSADIFNIGIHTIKRPLQNKCFLFRVSSILYQQKYNLAFKKFIVVINKMTKGKNVIDWKEFIIEIEKLLQ